MKKNKQTQTTRGKQNLRGNNKSFRQKVPKSMSPSPAWFWRIESAGVSVVHSVYTRGIMIAFGTCLLLVPIDPSMRLPTFAIFLHEPRALLEATPERTKQLENKNQQSPEGNVWATPKIFFLGVFFFFGGGGSVFWFLRFWPFSMSGIGCC